MKPILYLFLLALLLLGFKSFAQADSTDKISETVVIKLLESNSFGMLNNVESKMIITGNNNEIQIKPLKRINFNRSERRPGKQYQRLTVGAPGRAEPRLPGEKYFLCVAA